MFSNKDRIKTALKDLILNDDREFVAMLSGEWGIGKTYFWNEFKDKYLKDKDVVYISLFGKNSLQDIETEIVTKLYRYTKGLKKYRKHFDTISNLGSKAMGLPINVSIGSILSLFSPNDFKNIIICFDDFERLSEKVSLKDVLGLISQFKEQKECKIIMILNEQELDKLSDIDGKKHDEIFALYKEKIVDYNFHYMPSQEELFDAIKADIEKIEFCNNQYIYNFFKKIDLKNIRIMKQALYQLNHFSFIKDYKLDNKVIEGFVEIALNLFVFKAKCNFSHKEFVEMKQYQFNKAIDKKDFKEIEKYKKCLKSHNEIPYLVTKDDTENIIYMFIENHSIDTMALNDLLKLNHSTLHKSKIQDKLHALNKQIYSDFNSSLKNCTNEMYELLITNKEDIPYILDIGDLPYYINLIKEHGTLVKKEFIDDVIKSYIDIKPKRKRFSFSFERYKTFLEEHYPDLITYLEEKKNEQLIEKTNITNLKKLLDKVSSGWSPEDAYILNNLTSKVYKEYIIESSEFYYDIIDFLSHHKNTQDFNGAIQNIKKSLIDLKQENNDSAWRVNKLLKEVNIKLEDENNET